MNFIWSSAEISKTPSYRQLLHWWHYAVTEAVMATTILPNFKLRDLGTSPFYYEINNTRPARSERGKRDLQYSQVWCLSGLYWTRYSYSKTQKLLRNISDVRKVLPWVPEVFLACGGNFRCWLDRNWNRARKVSGTQGRKVCGNISILAPLTPILRFILTAMCSFLLCESCVVYPIIHELVLSPPWFEIRPCAPLRAVLWMQALLFMLSSDIFSTIS